MSILQKIQVSVLVGLFWILAIVGKHFWPDIDVGALIAACQAILAGLGITHVMANSAVSSVTDAASVTPDNTVPNVTK